MSLTSISSTVSTSLLQRLQAAGLSTQKATLVATDVGSALGGKSGTAVSPTATRATVDAKIAADVSSGKLSDADAAKVKKALDDFMGGPSDATGDSRSDDAAATSTGGTTGAAPARAGGSGGGGGGGGSASKTEASELITVSGTVKTTVITYTDGTTATTTSAATPSDEQRYGGRLTSSTDSMAPYETPFDKGLMVDETA